jgi:PAS domain S-box-containing protein
MSQQRSLKRPLLTPNHVANSSTECNSTPHKRRRQTNQALEALGQLIKDPTFDDIDNKLNKNDILSLTLARLLRRKYWPSHVLNTNVQLAAGIESSSIDDDLNGFIIVLNTNGRIVLMSDNVEYYLRKNVRSLYPQLTSIYDCVSDDDHESIRRILSTPTNTEQRVICTWNLPRGKRPSRTHTESKPMLMTGHFCFINNEENKEQQEPLFIARCEQILSSTPNIPTNSIGSTSTTTLRFVLTDQLNISEISSNTESLLGYNADELIDQSINRFIAGEHLHILEQARENCIIGQHYTTMNVLDLYTRHGDRLSFLCNAHMLIEGRRKAIKLGFLAQLIDPSIQYECAMYANKQNLERLKSTVQQEAELLSNINLKTSATTNILISKTEQCLNFKEIPTVRPVTVIPQRRKRRRINYSHVKNEPFQFGDQAQQIPQISNDLNESQISSSDSLTSSASPIQELGYMENLFPYIDDIFEDEKIKLIEDFPSIDDVNDVFGINNNQQFSLITPTMSTFSFFA